MTIPQLIYIIFNKLFINIITNLHWDSIGWARVEHPGSTSGGEILHHPIHLPHRSGGRLHIEVNLTASPLSPSQGPHIIQINHGIKKVKRLFWLFTFWRYIYISLQSKFFLIFLLHNGRIRIRTKNDGSRSYGYGSTTLNHVFFSNTTTEIFSKLVNLSSLSIRLENSPKAF